MWDADKFYSSIIYTTKPKIISIYKVPVIIDINIINIRTIRNFRYIITDVIILYKIVT